MMNECYNKSKTSLNLNHLILVFGQFNFIVLISLNSNIKKLSLLDYTIIVIPPEIKEKQLYTN